MDIIKILQEELGIRRGQVETTIKLIDEGNTIPFIARYRKEMTGSLDDETLRNFHERLLYLRNLEERKEAIKKNIEEQGKLTKELAKQIEEAKTLVAVEDLYRPYKQKKRTRAMIAKEKGLEPLANLILLQMTKEPLEKEAEAFINEEKDVKTVEDALKGADIFVGVSAPNIVSKEMVASMNKDAILFAMANPVPEIMPDLAKEAGAKVVGTGRSDFPNQVNNVVAFPGIFKGALEGRATQITEEMKLAAANAIAGLVPEEELNENNILPEAFDPRVADTVSKAIKDLI